MSELTPDPKKRGFLLPPGCKDLIDVLQQSRRKERTSPAPTPGAFPGWEVTAKLADLPSHVAQLADSTDPFCLLTIHPPDHRLTVTLRQRQPGLLTARLSVQLGTAQNQRVREFFARRCLPLPDDSETPAQFYPDLPVDQLYDLAAGQFGVFPLARLVTALFREAAGLGADSELCFRCYEPSLSA